MGEDISSRAGAALRSGWSARLFWALLAASLLRLRTLWPAGDLDSLGPFALRDGALSLAHWLLFLLIATAAGLWVVRRIDPPGVVELEELLYAAALGLGLLGYLVLAVGFAGLLYPVALDLLTVLMAFLLGPNVSRIIRSVSSCAHALRDWLRSGTLLEWASVGVGGLIALLALVHTLGPAWDYDGLMYHLPGPAYYLENHRLLPNLENWYVNGPFAVEMLFTFGLAHGDEVFAKLLHYAFGWMYVASAVAVARRWLGPRQAWLSAIVLLGIPTLPIWAAFAYVDLGWASFEFLALAAGLLWWQTRSDRWLVLAGLLIGLAMGSKFPGLAGAAALGGLLILASVREGTRRVVRNVALFVALAGLVASPWYVKNWLWFGNPVYPLYFGGPGWDAERLNLYMAYLSSFGAGRELIDWLLLPWNIYARNSQFGAVMNQIDVPGLLFPLVLLYPWSRGPRAIGALLGFAAVRGALWAVGSQQTRFLLPVFPALAVATAHVLLRLRPRSPGRIPWHVFLPTLGVGLAGLTLFYQVVVMLTHAPLRPVLGWESGRQFLRRVVRSYPAVDFIHRALPSGSRALQLGNGQIFYCPTKCVADPDHFRWAAQINRFSTVFEFDRWMRAEGHTHVLLSWEDIDFLLQHDPTSTMLNAVLRLKQWMTTPCFREVFADEWNVVAEVGCP
jgi:hypothetical protein